MSIRKVPDDEILKIPGSGIVSLIVKRQKGAKLSDYLVYIKENGEEISNGREPKSSEYTFDGGSSKDDSIIGNGAGIKSDSSISDSHGLGGYTSDRREIGSDSSGLGGYTSDRIESGSDTHIIDGVSGTGEYTSEQFEIDDNMDGEEDSKEDDEDKKRGLPLLKKYAIRGASLGLAGLLLLAIGGTKQITHKTTYSMSDYSSVEEVSDIELICIDGKYVQYAGSVYQDPGKMIHDMRDAAIGEQNGNYEGIRKYFSSQTEEERIAEEEKILAISDAFQEQQRLISENEEILRSPTATDSEKKNALENIKSAKKEMKKIYHDNLELYLTYTEAARDAYDSYSDDRTQQEKELTRLGESEYTIAMKNLDLDVQSLQDSLTVLDNPQMLFKEPPSPEGTVDTTYIVDTSVLGHDIQFGMVKSDEVTELEYDPAISAQKGGSTITNGEVIISEQAIQTTHTTRKGIFAVMDILSRALRGEEIGQISFFGRKIHDDPHIK